MPKKWIKKAVSGGKGSLHRHLGVPEGDKIPSKKMKEAKNSKSPEIRKEASLSHTLGSFHRKSKSDLAKAMYKDHK